MPTHDQYPLLGEEAEPPCAPESTPAPVAKPVATKDRRRREGPQLPRTSRVKPGTKVEAGQLQTPKAPKKPKVKKDHTLRGLFRGLLSTLKIEEIKRPWMLEKSFRLIDTDAALAAWVDEVLADDSKWLAPYEGEARCPIVAVDTETTGLDTRILIHLEQKVDEHGEEQWIPHFEVKIELAGVCLSVDGIGGVYIPLNHEGARNVSRRALQFHLQRLFDRSHLVFYNAKFDREVLRLTAGIEFRPYPHFEDVQVLYFNVDPKATLEDSTYSGTSGGLKALTKEKLKLDQIELAAIGKVTAEWCPRTESSECTCDEAQRKAQKHNKRVQYVPFTWIPTDIALWYAAADSIATWLLWQEFRVEAQGRRAVHEIDGHLVDALTWIERQRAEIAEDEHQRLVKWFMREMEERRENLRQIALRHGWPEQVDEQGNLIEETKFDVDKKHLPELLFVHKHMEVVKKSVKTDAPSVDKEALAELMKKYPNDEFLEALAQYKKYVALHPENLRYDVGDKTARVYLKQSVVAGGRLAASGGKYQVDGGIGLNIQAVKKVEGNWWLKGRVLIPDEIPESEIEPHEESELPAACFKGGKPAPGILHNHIAHFNGYAICLIDGCTTCAGKFGILIEDGRLDANQVVNLRALFIAAIGWTFLSSDYSNIEMRVAANVSKEPEFIKEFLEGSGDFHSLTASKVFAEFNDPRTSKAERKLLRSLAKIINFALLYGGTRFTIFENMRKMRPEITMKETSNMVEAYWRGVPVYKGWCDHKIEIAKTKLLCETETGRVIKFQSAMDAEKIKKPEKEDWNHYFDYIRKRKTLRIAEDNHDQEAIAILKPGVEALYHDETKRIRNTQLYNRFMSKIERISVNVPLQGLAGDFMRMAIIAIARWATVEEPEVQSVLRMHFSVHDELDYTSKNEYVPFVVPRVTRLMKLRRLHEERGWPVGIEADTEYGPRSWDVAHHVTGDDDHAPAGWTEIAGLEQYLPDYVEPELVDALVSAIATGRPKPRDGAWSWAEQAFHPRALEAFKAALWGKDKDKKLVILTDPAVIRKQVIAAFQLDEYWRIDATPDGETLETLAEYEARRGLRVRDRGFMPPGGFLSALPLDGVERPAPYLLGPAPVPDPPPDPPAPQPEPEPAPEPAQMLLIPAPSPADDLFDQIMGPAVSMRAFLLPAKPAPPEQSRYRRRDLPPDARNRPQVPPPRIVARLRPDLTADQLRSISLYIQPHYGELTMRIFHRGREYILTGLGGTELPRDLLEADMLGLDGQGEQCA